MKSITISPQKKNTKAFWDDPSVPIVSVLAHELRNPLTNIMLTVHMLESRILDDNDRLFLDIIKRSSTKINDLIDDLLKGQKKNEMPIETHSVQQLLDEVIELARDNLVLKRIVVKKYYAWPDLKVKIDKPRVKIALMNIIINAIDAMPPVNGELRLGIKLIRGSYAITIQDNGRGISEENLPLIFNPFFTNKPGGLGVGLAATKDILLSNRIGIKIESMVGQGTCFNLLFGKNHIVAGRRKFKNRDSIDRCISRGPVEGTV